MELKLDVKTLVIGIALGIMITAALGVVGGSADKADFGIAIGDKGSALVRADNGSLFVVNSKNGMATRVLHVRNLSADPDDRRSPKGNPFFLGSSSR